jgi:hypothetical protein
LVDKPGLKEKSGCNGKLQPDSSLKIMTGNAKP